MSNSSGGFCGDGDQYCEPPTCQEDYGQCKSNSFPLGNFPECSWSPEGTSPRCDGKCGSAYRNAICSSTASADAFKVYGVYNYGPFCSSAGLAFPSRLVLVNFAYSWLTGSVETLVLTVIKGARVAAITIARSPPRQRHRPRPALRLLRLNATSYCLAA